MKTKPMKSNKCALFAPDRNTNIYDDYVDDILLPAEKKKFEQHLEKCPICSREVVNAFRLDEMVMKSPLMSVQGQKRSLNVKLEYLNTILGRNEDDLAFAEDVEPLALAASPPRRLDDCGVAYGVAVNKETNQGILLKCTAAVSDKIVDQSPLEVRAKELKSFARKGMEYKISVPTTLLENLLKDMFVTHPLLRPLKLYDKTIRVHVDFAEEIASARGKRTTLNSANCYICEADSLELAVLIAILSAVNHKKVDGNTVFSSGVSLNGCLEPVGDLKQKIACAQRQGIKVFMMAEANRMEHEKIAIKKVGLDLHYFEKLEDILSRLGLMGKKTMAKSDKIRKSGEIKKKNNE